MPRRSPGSACDELGNADPVATVAVTRDWGVHVIMGNCEESLGWSKNDCGFEEICSRLAIAFFSSP